MKLSEAMKFILPGSLDAIKQAWRQGHDWRKVVHSMHPPASPDKDHWPAHTAFLDEFCDCLEEQFFPGLPVIVRHQGRGQPELLKGSTGRRGEITVRRRR